MENIEGNDGIEVFGEENFLNSLSENEAIEIDAEEWSLFGKKRARLTLNKN
jgi:hypothetical protein